MAHMSLYLNTNTIIFLFSNLFSFLGVLLAVAFFTLMERKIIGLIHYRKGPNKVIISGLLQPMSDAAKLLSKESIKFNFMKYLIFSLGPCVGLILILICWGWYESLFNTSLINIKIFPIAAIIGLSSFVFLITSWGSNRKYAILGGYRAIAQVVSYEVCLVLFIIRIFYVIGSYSITSLKEIQRGLWIGTLRIPLFILWITICIAESNRTPFDTAEGESEIVSGFNIEYGGGLFALIFIAEYGIILFLRFLTSMVFLGNSLIILKTFMLGFIFIWIRCRFPRIRYDLLIITAWKIALPYRIIALTLRLRLTLYKDLE